MGQVPSNSREATAEAWTFYSVVIVVAAARYTSQAIHRGSISLGRASADDWLMAFAICTYTMQVWAFYLYGAYRLHLDYHHLSEDDMTYYGRTLGILALLGGFGSDVTLWCVKGCQLIVYNRLASNQWQRYAVRATAVYCVLGYIAVVVGLFYGWCRPFSQNFLLFPTVEQCMTWKNFSILQMAFNIPSDLMIFAIPLSLVLNTQFKLAKKIMLVCVFSLGIFVITCATLTKSFVLLNPLDGEWVLWLTREVSTSMLVCNLTLCFPLVRKIWSLRPKTPKLASSVVSGPSDETYIVESKDGENAFV